MAYSIYSKAGTDEAISSALADSLPTAPADIGAATAAQGALADATTVEQVTLTAPLAYTLPTGTPAGVVHRVVFTQNGTGGHTVTYDDQPVSVDPTAGASTTVELHPVGTGYVVRYPADAIPGATGPRWSAHRYGVRYDGTDQTANMQALLAAVSAAGGGVIELDGLVRCDGQIVMPTTTVGTQARQAPIRITGTAANMPGSTWTGGGTWADAPGLDLRYAGRTDANCDTTLGSAIVLNPAAVAGDRGNLVTGPGIPDQAWILAVQPGVSWTLSRAARATGTVPLISFGGRIQALGYGMIELDHLQLVSGAPSSAPFVLTTGATIKAHHNLFRGSTTKGGVTCDEDPFVLGGPGQGTALTSPLTSGQSYSTLAVDALPVGIKAGATLVLNYGCGTTQDVVVPAAVAVGAVSIPVATFTANADYPARTSAYIGGFQLQESASAWSVPSAPFQGYGTHISDTHFHRCRRISVGGFATSLWIDHNAWMHNCGSNLAATPSTLTAQITAGGTITALAVTALSAPVIAGDVIQVGVLSAQEFTATAPAAAGATSITVASATATNTHPVGTVAFNTTAGLGAALECRALPGSVSTVYMRDNRIGMSGGYTHLTRCTGQVQSSLLTGNEWQDSHANGIAGHRFDHGAEFNLVIPGMLATSKPLVDDLGGSQTVITPRQSAQSVFPQGLRLGVTTTITRTAGGSFYLNDNAGRNVLDSSGALRLWGIHAPVAIVGNEQGSGTCALTIGNNSTDSDSVITLNTKGGRTGGLQFRRAGANSWYIYDAGSANLHVRDSVNSKNHISLTPGAGAGGGTTEVNSALKVLGSVGFFGTTPSAKPTVTGSRASGEALTSLLAALATLGLITDSTIA